MEKFIQSLIKNLVKWAPSGASVSIMFHSLMSRDWMEAILASFLTAASTLWVSFSSKYMEEAEKEVEKRGGGLAKWTFVVGDRIGSRLQERFISAWRYFISDFEDKYYQRLIYICRNYETQGLDKDQVLNLRQVFVPLKISPQSLAKISPNLIQDLPTQLSRQQDIGQILIRMANDSAFRRLAILGAPGSGKTTLLRYITLIYANRQQRKLLDSKAPSFIPVLIYLRDVRQEIVKNPKLPLINLIHDWLQGLQTLDPLGPPPGWFAEKLKQNRCLILLDGLDEIADETERQRVSRWVDFQMKEYPETAFILSSRPLGYTHAKLRQDVTILEVQPFNLKQVEEFIHNWYLEIEIRSQGNKDDLGVKEDAKRQADDLVTRIQDSAPLVTMAVNPLLLTMIAVVHRRGSALPGKRVKLYEEICQVLLEKRQLAKDIPDTLTVSQKQSALQFLAIALMHNKTRSFKLNSKVDKLLQRKLALASHNIPTSADFLKQMREVTSLLIEKEPGVYEFAHLSFQEYLASVEIIQSNKASILINAIKDSTRLSWWAETIRLYCAQTDASDIINAALYSNNIATLSLAFDCLEEEASMQPSIREALETRLIQGLESTNETLFRLAAEVKLSRRLAQLLRIDQKRAIDTTYITCAEYQLFINERRQQQESYQPAHWNDYHFSSGAADRPITGVRASDAQAFCEWLSQRTGQNYRLPNQQEVQSYPIVESRAITWGKESDADRYKLMGTSQWQQRQPTMLSSLRELFILDFNRLHTYDHTLVRAFDLARDQIRSFVCDPIYDHTLARVLNLDQDLDLTDDRAWALNLARGLSRDLVSNTTRARTYAQDLARARAQARDLDRTRAQAIALDQNISLVFTLDNTLVRNLIPDLRNTLGLARTSIRSRTQALARARARNLIRAYLSAFLLILELLINTYEQYLESQLWNHRNRKKIQTVYGSRKDALVQKFHSIFDTYFAFAMLHLRQKNKLPAWESIRIVREEEE